MTGATSSPNAKPHAKFDVRRMSWKRLAALVVVTAAIAFGLTYVGDNTLVMNADGLVLNDRVVAAAPYEARIKKVFVRSGDFVNAGDRIAIVESASMSRSLADLAIQRARLTTTIAQLQARRAVVDALLPVAKANGSRMQTLVAELEKFRERGMTSFLHLQQITAEAYTAGEKLASLQAEAMSSEEQLRQNRAALAETNLAYDQLKSIFADGILSAPASGVVGTTVADAGDVITPGKKVVEIHTGTPYVLAYLADSSFVSVEEGEQVQVRTAARSRLATVEKILPLAEALPPEFQKPVRARDRGQLLRIALADTEGFVTDQKVRVAGCYITGCGDVTVATISRVRQISRLAVSRLKDVYAVVEQRVEMAATRLSQWILDTYISGLRDGEEDPNPHRAKPGPIAQKSDYRS